MIVYTRPQLVVLLALLAAAGAGLAIGHWRARHPDLVERLERFDHDAPAPAAAAPSGSRPPRPGDLPAPVEEPGLGPPVGPAADRRHPEVHGPPDRPLRARAAQAPPARSLPAAGQQPAGAVDVNRAPLADLTRLPGVGPVLAARIIAERDTAGRFASVEALRRVRGVGPATLERLRAHVTVGD
jgi:competence ComEA-like helix-hairpin-helix protein